MATSYEWSFPSLDVTYNEIDPQTEEPVQNVVTTVHWVYTARDGITPHQCTAQLAFRRPVCRSSRMKT